MKKLFELLVTICSILTLCSGCSKDNFTDYYKEINEKVGDIILTNKSKLKGTREFGKDHYTGIYNVTYKEFTGEETIFGGTTIERDDEDIHVKLDVDSEKGNIKVIMSLKEKEETLATENGSYEFDFNVKDGSNYLIIEADDYSGKVNIEIE